MIVQATIFDSPAPSFSSSAVASNRADVAPLDMKQWAPALQAVYEVMRDGRWRTLAEIAFASNYPEASVSARIRDLHNRKGLQYEKRKAPDGKLYSYRLI